MPASMPFQSLSWDGVVSDYTCAKILARDLPVSIPQLGWGGFRQMSIYLTLAKFASFNPSVEGWASLLTDYVFS